MVLDKEEKVCYVLEFKRVRFSFLAIFLGRRALSHPESLKLTYGMRREYKESHLIMLNKFIPTRCHLQESSS